MDLRQTLEALEVDVETTLHRFGGNEPLLERFVRKLIERLAHTLKGTSANLGFQILSDQCHELVQAIRDGETQPEQLKPFMDKISAEYEKIMAAIEALGQ